MHIIEHNVETGEIKQIELSPSEIKVYEAEAKKYAEESAKRLAEQTQKVADRAALLARMGLTEDEARLLLG